ncbi:hypothetical protein O181_013357 [Austropuccinia psidii MF-1]|uniref:GH16 domain-containing protein n=1 Tax=Austropuccinia psidii MF-1 TaxID=1389203 RepID=A0A9Q3BZH0_9BASI|nr:hypothetical protein [Austropuccinia psidii MF-1]
MPPANGNRLPSQRPSQGEGRSRASSHSPNELAFGNRDSSYLASPASVYSQVGPTPARFPIASRSPHIAHDLTYSIPSLQAALPDTYHVLSTQSSSSTHLEPTSHHLNTTYSATSLTNTPFRTPESRSQLETRFSTDTQFVSTPERSYSSSPAQLAHAEAGLGISGINDQELMSNFSGGRSQRDTFEITEAANVLDSPPAPQFQHFNNEEVFFDEHFDSSQSLHEQQARRGQEAVERTLRRMSQNPDYMQQQAPPPEVIEIPTAEDIRFGMKHSNSSDRHYTQRNFSPGENSSKKGAAKSGWRFSLFGNVGKSATDINEQSYFTPGSDIHLNKSIPLSGKGSTSSAGSTGPLSILPNNTIPRRLQFQLYAPGFQTSVKPEANFIRPLSMAPDENFTMMRGNRSDMNPTPMYFSRSENRTGSHASFISNSVLSAYRDSFNSNAAMKEQIKLLNQKSPLEKQFDFLPESFEAFDFREVEPDDALHDPGPLFPRKGLDRMIIETRAISGPTRLWSTRGWLNSIGLILLAAGLVTLFAVFPIVDYFVKDELGTLGGYNIGGINASGQVPQIKGFKGMIDADTPHEALTKIGVDGTSYQLVFSDEFNEDGRTFWPGDDPYWEAVNLHYWATSNLEWYDPDQIITQNGSLVISLDHVKDPSQNHDLNYRGGMLQSWNKFCFTGGIIEASISLPGASTVPGLWPAFWTMGNLGRAGYGASLDGLWPYSYDTCDIGTLPNQTNPQTKGPAAVHTMGDPYHGNELSYLPGQRLSRCTCPQTAGSNYHPGPKHPDGSWVGRSAPEIDVLEGIVDQTKLIGQVSQSAQFAPYNAHYKLNNLTEGFVDIYQNSFQTELNPYTGGIYQQAASGLSNTDASTYNGAGFASYGYEYAPSDSNNAFIAWTQQDQPMWKITSGAIGPDPLSQIGPRTISNEPMYILLNLGISAAFGKIDFPHLKFPSQMRVDWVRVYQPAGSTRNTNCDPPSYPTSQYIRDHLPAYTNPNITTWAQYQENYGDQSGNSKTGFPKNKLLDTC